MEYTRAEVKAGILIVVSLVILGGMIYFVSNFKDMFIEKQIITARFEQVGGMNEGSPVRFAGRVVGHVSSIEPYTDPETGKQYVEIISRVHKDLKIPKDSLTLIGAQLTGDVWLDITPGPGEPFAPGEEVLLIGKPGFTPIELQAKLVKGIEKLEEFISGERPKVSETLSLVRKTAEDLSQTASTVRQYVETDVKTFLANANDAAAGAKRVISENEEAVKTTTANLRDTSSQMKDLVSANREKVDEIVTRLSASSESVQTAAQNFEKASAGALGLVDENRRTIKEAIGSLRDTAVNLKLASEDLRRNPWKLTYRPSKQDRKDWEIYEVAVNLSESARAVDSAASRLQAVSESPGVTEEEQSQQLAKALEELNQMLLTMQKSGEALYERLSK